MDEWYWWLLLPVGGWALGRMIGHLIIGDIPVPRIPIVSPAWDFLRWRVTEPLISGVDLLIRTTSNGVDKLLAIRAKG